MTLGAIAASIGLIIDDAIVVVEQIHRTHEEHPDELTRHLLRKALIIFSRLWWVHLSVPS
jgi:multidrug efflux pump subunit AcrB